MVAYYYHQHVSFFRTKEETLFMSSPYLMDAPSCEFSWRNDGISLVCTVDEGRCLLASCSDALIYAVGFLVRRSLTMGPGGSTIKTESQISSSLTLVQISWQLQSSLAPPFLNLGAQQQEERKTCVNSAPDTPVQLQFLYNATLIQLIQGGWGCLPHQFISEIIMQALSKLVNKGDISGMIPDDISGQQFKNLWWTTLFSCRPFEFLNLLTSCDPLNGIAKNGF